VTFSVSEYRDHARRFLLWACGPGDGYPEPHPIYQQVTEGRDKPPYPNKYSSCGDLAMAMLEHLGVRLSMVNRAKLNGGFRYGLNVSLLAYSRLAREPRPDDRFEAGDVLIVWDLLVGPKATTDAHVICPLDEFPETRKILTAEYGQPGGAVRTRGISRLGGGTSIGGRSLQRVLKLDDVLEQADRLGKLVPVDADGNAIPGDAS
jgi:hypothetical protein